MTAPAGPPPVVVALMDLGPPTRDRRVAAIERSLAARKLAQALLARVSGTTGWSIETERNGRPRARHPGSSWHCDLSIAHSGALVAAAVCDRGALGIDIERHKPERDHRGIARLTFGPQEQAMAERGGIASFYRLWTLREAISKATGQGLAMFMDGIDRLPAEPHTGHWLSADRQWLLAHLEPRPNLSLALAVLHEAPVAAGDWSPASVCWLSQPEVDAWSRLPDHSLHQDREWRAKAPV